MSKMIGRLVPLGFGLATVDAQGEATFRATPAVACILERIRVAGSTQPDETKLIALMIGDRHMLRYPWPLAFQGTRDLLPFTLGPFPLPAPWQLIVFELPALMPVLLRVRVPDAPGAQLVCGCEVTIGAEQR